MGQVIVRKLDEQVIKGLKERAALNGHSLERELRDILTDASRLDAHQKLGLLNRIREMSDVDYNEDSAALIRRERDRR